MIEPCCTPSKVVFSSRFATHTFPYLSTVVREGFGKVEAPESGFVEYSPSTSPVLTSIRTAVPRPETAMLTKGNGFVSKFSCSWSLNGASWLTFTNEPSSKSASVV